MQWRVIELTGINRRTKATVCREQLSFSGTHRHVHACVGESAKMLPVLHTCMYSAGIQIVRPREPARTIRRPEDDPAEVHYRPVDATRPAPSAVGTGLPPNVLALLDDPAVKIANPDQCGKMYIGATRERTLDIGCQYACANVCAAVSNP